MIQFPTICVDDFFTDPKSVIRFAEKVEFFPSKDLPFLRTHSFSDINPRLHQSLSEKILQLMYSDLQNLEYKIRIFFQLMKNTDPNEDSLYFHGGIHQDINCLAAGVLYLNDSYSKDSGTTLFEPKTTLENIPHFSHQNRIQDKKNYMIQKSLHEKQFNESVIFKNKFNRLILFDAKNWHRANCHFDPKERLVIVFFIDQLSRMPDILSFRSRPLEGVE